MRPFRILRLSLVLTCLLCSVLPVWADSQVTVAGYPHAEAIRLGERMYLHGILPDGTPMKAVVQGDLEVSGAMTTCSNCHQRSGMGSLEGGIVTPPTNGAKLFAPLAGARDLPGSIMKRSMATTHARPAYTDRSLADVLRTGVDPRGRRLSSTMPLYLLDDTAATILTYYLRNLSSEISPGVTDDEIRFATIVTAGSSSSDKDAMILPLKAFLQKEWNGRLAEFISPWNAWNLTVKSKNGKSYRKATLDIWELKGSPDSWNSQLEGFYRKKPVFAVLGGLAPEKWDPIHIFCETNKIPCILPITELPVISTGDWYTLYFSKGYYQEGEAAANYLSRVVDLPPERQVVQVYRDNLQSTSMAEAFATSWNQLGNSTLNTVIVADGQKTGGAFWSKLAARYPGAVLMVWLDQTEMAGLSSLVQDENKPTTIFVSNSMLSGSLASLPEAVREFTFITYPTRLPHDMEYSRSIVTNWMKFKKIPIENAAISSKMYLVTRLLSFALLDMGIDFYRDFFMDILDNGSNQPNSLAYPMLSFGPGQRYASKGCYIVTLTTGETPRVIRQSDWVIY